MPSIPHSPDVGNVLLQDCACTTLRKTSRTITRLYDEALKPSGLLATQYMVLVAIQKEHPVTIGRLAEVMVMDRTTLTRNLRPLEKKGLIASGKGEDQRTHVVSLTLKGKTVLEKTFPLWQRVQTHVATTFGPKKFVHLLSDLKEVVVLFRER